MTLTAESAASTIEILPPFRTSGEDTKHRWTNVLGLRNFVAEKLPRLPCALRQIST
jgi:hypothetical protein